MVKSGVGAVSFIAGLPAGDGGVVKLTGCVVATIEGSQDRAIWTLVRNQKAPIGEAVLRQAFSPRSDVRFGATMLMLGGVGVLVTV